MHGLGGISALLPSESLVWVSPHLQARRFMEHRVGSSRASTS